MESDRPKMAGVMDAVRKHLREGSFRDTCHAVYRRNQRRIQREEILYVLMNGHHEMRKDRFDEYYEAWNYAIRGKTIDRRDLRVIVSFDASNMLVITAIELQ